MGNFESPSKGQLSRTQLEKHVTEYFHEDPHLHLSYTNKSF